ncbi:MAG TPA: phosphate ABC transporter substrate-binding protein PstS [Nitrososphaerales archaeon]|nr:phosphate ABC transporter substrate-binding protein PstS [Nitrososphaerales archaeon]
MNFNRRAINTTTTALAVILIIVIIAFAAYAAIGVGKTTVTETETISTTVTGSATTATATVAVNECPGTNITLSSYTPPAGKISLTAGGSTFVNPIMQVWVAAYGNLTENEAAPVLINYAGVGSSSGQMGVLANTFAYAGSDAPLSASVLAGYKSSGPMLQIPEALGGVAIFYNIPGVSTNLNFTGPVLAAIWNGSITTWNDPRITALNPGATLPSATIVPVHRSDGSGTTYALSTYLATQSPSWASTIGVGTSINWPTSEESAKGSSGVAGLVSTTPDSIGYADSHYALSNNLLSADIQNAAGKYVAPTVAGFSAAAAAAASTLSTNATATIVNPPASAATAYPISTFTYFLVWANQSNEATAWALANFMNWVVTYGQSYSTGLNYSPLPPSTVTADQHLVSQINFNGQTFTCP